MSVRGWCLQSESPSQCPLYPPKADIGVVISLGSTARCARQYRVRHRERLSSQRRCSCVDRADFYAPSRLYPGGVLARSRSKDHGHGANVSSQEDARLFHARHRVRRRRRCGVHWRHSLADDPGCPLHITTISRRLAPRASDRRRLCAGCSHCETPAIPRGSRHGYPGAVSGQPMSASRPLYPRKRAQEYPL
jgi:hypothetical protein